MMKNYVTFDSLKIEMIYFPSCINLKLICISITILILKIREKEVLQFPILSLTTISLVNLATMDTLIFIQVSYYSFILPMEIN